MREPLAPHAVAATETCEVIEAPSIVLGLLGVPQYDSY